MKCRDIRQKKKKNTHRLIGGSLSTDPFYGGSTFIKLHRNSIIAKMRSIKVMTSKRKFSMKRGQAGREKNNYRIW